VSRYMASKHIADIINQSVDTTQLDLQPTSSLRPHYNLPIHLITYFIGHFRKPEAQAHYSAFKQKKKDIPIRTSSQPTKHTASQPTSHPSLTLSD
jgi:hypothetical protein